ncbi:MAG: DUF2085 domain-containing protein [Chloroflexi bacterium]|nr:DUF2085 domain-containing protein [Chloroflexota bacterium]
MTITTNEGFPPRNKKFSANQVFHWLSRRWMLLFSLLYGLYVGLPFLAPVFMKLGWEAPAKGIYFIYSFFCHQLPQRSLFFFGEQSMYPLGTIQTAWENTLNPLVLRQFIGNVELGWKVAWSDRMISMYTSILIFAWLWYPLRKKLKPANIWIFFILIMPMAVDGVTHFLSDFAGFGQGFRDTNLWLSDLTNNQFSAGFYAGDALGSFNSWMRFITGTVFGLGVVWFGFPILAEEMTSLITSLENRLSRAAASGEAAVEGQAAD